MIVLVDPALPGLLDDARLLLGADAASELTAGYQMSAPTILHSQHGSELSGASEAARGVYLIVHRADSSVVTIRDPSDPPVMTSIADFPVFEAPTDRETNLPACLSNKWERAAALGRLYLQIGVDVSTSRLVALAVAAMDVAAGCTQTRATPPMTGRFATRVDRGLLGIPCVIVAPNAAYSRPYLADRAGLRITVRSSDYLAEQPVSFWPHREEASGRVLLPPQQPLEDAEQLVVLDDCLIDLAVGTPMVAVRRLATGTDGYLTLDALVTKCEGAESDIWVGDHPEALRPHVEFRTPAGTIYSTNFVGPKERKDSIEFLSRFLNAADDLGENVPHPLQVGAHAHRLGTWALDETRSAEERDGVARLFAATFDRYLTPKAMEVTPGAVTWPYEFDFQMPWATALRAPWFGGYSHAAITGTLAVGWALTGDTRWKVLARHALGYLKLPSENGGATYSVDGFQYLAEYAYRMPPIPNYRVLDGELCAPQYLHNAGLLLDDPELVALSHRLACGLTVPLRLLRRLDGAPLFGMDGQDMNPNYMWQLWMCLQLLAAMTKDRTFAAIARGWKQFIPANFWAEGYPS